MREYVVVKIHNFDPEVEAAKFTDYDKAVAYLHWMWETYLNEEYANESDVDEEFTVHDTEYAKVQWEGGDYTEFVLIEVGAPREDFPVDWERYI